MKKICISKYRSVSATPERPKQHDWGQDHRLAALSAAIRAGEASGEAIGFDPQRHLLTLHTFRIKQDRK